MRPLDTSSEATEVQLDIFRRMGPERRLQLGMELIQTSRKLVAEGVRRRHPEYTEDQIRLAIIRIVLPEELLDTAFPEAAEIRP